MGTDGNVFFFADTQLRENSNETRTNKEEIYQIILYSAWK